MLVYPNVSTAVPDADLEFIVRLTLEARRRVKEQQRRVFKSEFRNTHFSYTLGPEGVETFVATPELQSDQAIESDPLPPGQVWAIASASVDGGAGLYRIEVSNQPGSGARILNHPAPPAFRESVKVGEQILFAQARSLVGDRDPRAQEFTIQLRAIDADKSGSGLGVAVLTALCGSVLGRNSRGGTILVGSASLGGSLELVPNAVQFAELAIEKQAQTILMPVSVRAGNSTICLTTCGQK
jgi:ATP-dependent Lon protease